MLKSLLLIAFLFLLGISSGTGMVSSGSGTSLIGSGTSLIGSGLSSGLGLPSGTGYTPWQEGAMEGFGIGFHMGQMYNMAQQGYNISGFNVEVDRYNAWIQQNFGNVPNLLMSRMQENVPGYEPMPGYVPRMPGYMPRMPGYMPQTTPVIVFRDPLGWV
jgi:hypothetical protein